MYRVTAPSKQLQDDPYCCEKGAFPLTVPWIASDRCRYYWFDGNHIWALVQRYNAQDGFWLHWRFYEDYGNVEYFASLWRKWFQARPAYVLIYDGKPIDWSEIGSCKRSRGADDHVE